MSNSIQLQPDGGIAAPVVASSETPAGNIAIPVYLYQGFPTDRDISAALPRSVIQITDSDLIEHGGAYQLAANQFAVPMFVAPNNVTQWSGAAPIAIYVVGNSPSSCTPVTPTFVSAEVGNINSTTVVVVFSEAVQASNFASGVTIKKNTISQTINSATLQGDNKTVYYVLNVAVSFGDTVTWEYAAASGHIVEAACGTGALANVSPQTVTNNVLGWWAEGGGITALQVLQAKNAASLVSSLLDLSGNSNNASASGSAPLPSWNATDGWVFSGGTKAILTGMLPAPDWSFIGRFSSFQANSYLIGSWSPQYIINPDQDGVNTRVYWGGIDVLGTTPVKMNDGVIAIAGRTIYENGLPVATLDPSIVSALFQVAIGCLNFNGDDSPVGSCDGNIQAMAFYAGTLTDAQVLAKSTALAAI